MTETRTLSGKELQRYNALRAFDSQQGSNDETTASARSRVRTFEAMAVGLNWDRLAATGIRTLEEIERPFAVELTAEQASVWLAVLTRALNGAPFERQRVLLPLIDQLEAHVEGRPSPIDYGSPQTTAVN